MKISSSAHKVGLVLESGFSPATHIGGRKDRMNKMYVLSTRRREVSSSFASSRTQQSANETVILDFSVSPEFLVDGADIELEYVLPF